MPIRPNSTSAATHDINGEDSDDVGFNGDDSDGDDSNIDNDENDKDEYDDEDDLEHSDRQHGDVVARFEQTHRQPAWEKRKDVVSIQT